MKTTSKPVHKIVSAGIVALFVLSGAVNLLADNMWDAHHHYRRDNYGYWDDSGHYRHFIQYHGHNGYWDNKGSVRVFINVD